MLKIIRTILQKFIDDIDAGNSNMSYEQEVEVLHLLQNIQDKEGEQMSKTAACDYLGISRATFDNNVRLGLIPKGEKRYGFKELSWRKQDLDKFLDKQ